jgi:photosystem II stability/assembly factor-like uncharacterized protein
MIQLATENFYRRLSSSLLCLVVLLLGISPAAAENSLHVKLATRSLLLDAQRIEQTLVAVGEWGHILFSDDNGVNWQQAQVPTRATLTGVHFVDRQHGWAVGHDQVILRTRDGGRSWHLVYQNPEAESPLLDVYFLNQQHGYAIGAYGEFLETVDSGQSWQYRPIGEDDWHLNQISAANARRLYIAAESGTLYRSDDAGKNWLGMTPPYEGSFFGCLPLTADQLLLFGLRGTLLRSEDAGESWTELETGTEASLTGGLILADGSIVIAGLAGTLLISRDGGLNFKLHQEADRKGFSAVLEAADEKLVGIGEFGIKSLPAGIFTAQQ